MLREFATGEKQILTPYEDTAVIHIVLAVCHDIASVHNVLSEMIVVKLS